MEYIPGCTGKVVYTSLAEAKMVKRAFTHSRGTVSIYHCRHLVYGVDHWHITSMPKQIFKKQRRAHAN